MKKILLFISLLILFLNTIAKAQVDIDTITFESGSNDLYIDTLQSNNIWQVGAPHKILFDSAFTKPNAIVTDTINAYPINNISSFIVKIKPPIGIHWFPNWPGPMPIINFTHKYNTDTIADGGHIEYSVDGGNIWLPVTLYDFNQIPPSTAPYYSGTSNLWQNTEIWFCCSNGYSGFADSILIKFIFTSDGINTNKEGWIIDNIIYGTTIGEGIETNYNNSNIEISPNPFSQSTQITLSKTYHSIALAVYDIQGKQVAQQHYADYDKIQLNRNQLSNGLYFLKLTLDDKAVVAGKIMISD